MPRPVVPIFAAPAASSRIRSRSWCSGRISGVFSAIIRLSGPIATPWPAQLADLGDQRPGVEHDAVADDAELARPHDARGQQRQLVDRAVDDQRVPGVVPALEARDHVGALGQPVDDLALALVAPLGADDHHVAHSAPGSSPQRPLPPASGLPWLAGSVQHRPDNAPAAAEAPPTHIPDFWGPGPRSDASLGPRSILERAKGFEPSTPTLARLCSTPELHPRPERVYIRGPAPMARGKADREPPAFSGLAFGSLLL